MSKHHGNKFQYGERTNLEGEAIAPEDLLIAANLKDRREAAAFEDALAAPGDHAAARPFDELFVISRVRAMLANIVENLDHASKGNMAPERVDASLALARLALEELR